MIVHNAVSLEVISLDNSSLDYTNEKLNWQLTVW